MTIEGVPAGQRLALPSLVVALFGCSLSANEVVQPDGGRAMSPPCPTLDAYCGDHPKECVRDWATAQLATTWCSFDAGEVPYDSINLRVDCSGFNFVFATATDTGVVYIYDAATGGLLGIGGESFGGNRCLAGDATPLSLGQSCGTGQKHLCGSIGAP